MGHRRMFSRRITTSAQFLKLPLSSQALYFHLGMHADDDGVVEAFKVLRIVGAAEDDMKILCAKKLVRVLNEDLVSHIIDWTEHNTIRADRKVDSIYKPLLLQICPETPLIEAKPRADTGSIATGKSGRPLGNQRTAQVKLSQVKSSEVNTNKDNTIQDIDKNKLEEFDRIFKTEMHNIGINPDMKKDYYSAKNKILKKIIKENGYTIDDILSVLPIFIKENKEKTNLYYLSSNMMTLKNKSKVAPARIGSALPPSDF